MLLAKAETLLIAMLGKTKQAYAFKLIRILEVDILVCRFGYRGDKIDEALFLVGLNAF